MKKSFFPFLAVTILCLLLTHPMLSFHGASQGLLLWYHTVLPTLLPFMICSNAVVSLNGIHLLTAPVRPLLKKALGLSDAGCYVLVSGLLCGYPMGAKTCGEFIKEKRISPLEGRFLLSVSNHPSPMFLLGYTASALGTTAPVSFLLAAVYLPIIPLAFLSQSFYHIRENFRSAPPDGQHRLSFDQSMMNSFEVMIKIGGYIMIFSILAEFISQIPGLTFKVRALILASVEITTGIQALSGALAGIPLGTALCFAVSFGGLCGLFQTGSVLDHPDLSLRHYLLWKLLHGTLSVIVFLLLSNIFIPGC